MPVDMNMPNFWIVMTCNWVGAKISEELSTPIFVLQKRQQVRLKQYVYPKLYGVNNPKYRKLHTDSPLEDQTVHDIL
jgi:hypothetical protein